MDIEFIYTFDGLPQEIADYDDVDHNIIKEKQSLFDYATRDFEDYELEALIKISCCVSDVIDIEPPQWFIEANGKLWITNGKLD